MARLKNYNAINVVNTINAAVNKAYQYNLPAVTKQTFANFADQLRAAPEVIQNEWHKTLVNLIGLQKIKNARAYESPFKKLRGEDIRTFDVQLLAMDLVEVKNYDPKNDSVEFFEDEPVNIEAQYLTKPLRLKSSVSIVEEELYGALTSEAAFMRYMDGVERALFNTMEMADVAAFKELITKNIAEGNIYLSAIAKPEDKDTALAFAKALKVDVNDLKAEMTPVCNLAHFYTHTPEGEGVLITDNETGATMDTYVTAWAFNKSFVELSDNGRGISVKSGSFGDVFALYADREFFEIHGIAGFPKVTEQYFGNTLQKKLWLHYWVLYATSLFSNVIAYVPSASIGISAATLDTYDGVTAYDRGADGKIIVKTVTAPSGKIADKFGSFSISGNASSKTVIDEATGRFSIGDDETAATLTVTWTSHLNDNVTATKAITVNGNE